MKILVSTPTYDGKISVEVVRCLFNEQLLAVEMGVDIQLQFLSGCSHAAMGRNQLATNFMKSDCDKIFFLDSDVSFAPGSIVKLSLFDVDFVGGAYRYKFDAENYPIGWPDCKELWSNEKGLIEVKSLPGGFLCISRNVFETFQKSFPDRSYEHFGKESFAYFQMRFENGLLWGEDSYFCKEWTDLGGKVYLYPELELTHWDSNRAYKGHIGNWLKSRPKGE